MRRPSPSLLLPLAILLSIGGAGRALAQADSAAGSVPSRSDSLASIDPQLPGSFISPSLKTSVGYLVDLPARYDSAGPERYPVLIFLHGIGERGNGGAELTKVDKWGLPRLAHHGERFPMIVISPQLPSNQKRWPVALIDELIDSISGAYLIDSTRIYLTGLSTGADGAWVYAVARPNRVAAIVPIAGEGSTSGICAMRNVAVWAFHGERDKDEPESHEQRLVDALNACQPPPAEPARLTVYAGAGHEVWSRTYDGSGGFDIFAWLLAHHR